MKATPVLGEYLALFVPRIVSEFGTYVWLGYGLRSDKVKGISCFSNIASQDGCAFIRVLPQGGRMKNKCMLV